MKADIINKATRFFYKAGFTLKKHSPTILVVGGCIGTVGAAVLAVKETPKALDILEEHKKKVEQINECHNDPEFVETYNYTDKAYKNELTGVYGKTALELAKTYAPAVIVGTLSITAILTSSNILKKRNMALASAYAVVDKGFKQYRSNVVERFGEQVDRELKYGLKRKEVTVEEIDENGETQVVTKEMIIADNEKVAGPYSEFFEKYNVVINEKGEKVKELNPKWTNSNVYNLQFLQNTETYLNKLLKVKGVIFYNEARDLVGFKRTKQGQSDGWIYDPSIPENEKQISFGLVKGSDNYDDYLYNEDCAILLDFNAQPNVWDNM